VAPCGLLVRGPAVQRHRRLDGSKSVVIIPRTTNNSNNNNNKRLDYGQWTTNDKRWWVLLLQIQIRIQMPIPMPIHTQTQIPVNADGDVDGDVKTDANAGRLQTQSPHCRPWAILAHCP
jgi:hypothetical protein